MSALSVEHIISNKKTGRTDGGHAVSDYQTAYRTDMGIPGRLIGGRIIPHGTGTAEGHGSFAVQNPVDAAAGGTLCHNGVGRNGYGYCQQYTVAECVYFLHQIFPQSLDLV